MFAVPPRTKTCVFRSAAKFSRATADVVSMAIAINPVDKSLIVVIEVSFFRNVEMPLARLAEVTDFIEDLVQSSSVGSFDLLMLTTQRAASVGGFFHIRPSLRCRLLAHGCRLAALHQIVSYLGHTGHQINVVFTPALAVTQKCGSAASSPVAVGQTECSS